MDTMILFGAFCFVSGTLILFGAVCFVSGMCCDALLMWYLKKRDQRKR